MSARGLTQSALAEILDIDRAMISRYLSGDKQPGDMVCLILAGLSDNPNESQFWVAKSGLEEPQLKLLAKALAAPEPKLLSGDEQTLLAWWRSPASPTEGYVKDLVEKVLQLRTKTP